MTSRERFHRTLADQSVDRPPLWDDGIREDVREVWARQGYPAERDLSEDFIIDRRKQIQPVIQHRAFLIGDDDLPAGENEDPVIDLPADDPRRYSDDLSDLSNPQTREFVVGLRVSRGLFLTTGVGGWGSLTRLLYLIADDPGRVRKAMAAAAGFAMKVLQRAFDELSPDYVLFNEPIASNAAPVIGPAAFRAACGDAYRRILEHARRCGVRWAIFQSYGNVTPLIAESIAMGMDAFWGGDTAAASLSYAGLRQLHGKALALVGGIDAGLLDGETARLADATRRATAMLLKSGRYIPHLDGRVRSHVTYEAYRVYRTALQSAVLDAGKTGGF